MLRMAKEPELPLDRTRVDLLPESQLSLMRPRPTLE